MSRLAATSGVAAHPAFFHEARLVCVLHRGARGSGSACVGTCVDAASMRLHRITTEKRPQDGRSPDKRRLEKQPAEAPRVEPQPGQRRRER